MAGRNEYRGGEERWRDERGRSARERERWTGGEPRSFGAEGEREPWRRDRYGSLYDQDRTNYGSGWDRERGGYGEGSYDRGGDRSFDREHRNGNRGDDLGYATRGRGQEDYRRTWRAGGDAARGDMEFGAGGRGYEQYGGRPGYDPHADLEPDYLHWRNEQLRLHDRDYEQWRNERHRQYDDDYRRFRAQRGGGSAHSFHEWRTFRNTATDMTRSFITPESHDYGARLYGDHPDRPSGALEFRTTRRRGRGATGPSRGDTGFADASPYVRAASEGWGGRGDPEEFDRHWRERDRDRDH